MDNGETGNIGYTGRRQAKQENTKQNTKKMSNQDPIKIRMNIGIREE